MMQLSERDGATSARADEARTLERIPTSSLRRDKERWASTEAMLARRETRAEANLDRAIPIEVSRQ